MLSNGCKRPDVLDRTGFDTLQKEFKTSCQFTRVLISVLQERVQLENDYAKGLSKIHSRLSKATVGLSGSVANGWSRTMENLEVEAKVHQDLSEKIASQLIPTSKAFIAVVDRDLKPISSEVDAATSRLQTARREECKSRKKAFTAYCLTCQNLSTNNINSSGLDGGNFGGGIDSARRTSTLLLQNRIPQYPSNPITSSSTNSPFKTAVRSASLRRVATLSTTQPSLEMSSASEVHSALPEKAARSVWRAILDLYRSNLASEEARIEWHSTLYQSASKLLDLERLRLSTLQETLESYRSAIMESIRSIEKAFQSTKDTLTKVNVEEDFLSFHGRAVVDSNAAPHHTSQPPLSNSRFTNPRALHRESKTQPSAVVGSTQQYLLCLPGEDDSLYTPSKEIQRQGIRQELQKRFLIFPKEELETINNEALADSTRKSEKAAFARQLLMSALRVLVRECQKEERTKQGLTNLVQVYSTGPIFTDDATLIEARRRLFSSRCRLAHLLACRARFACLFHLLSPDSVSRSSSLQNRLSEADFSADTLSTFSRRVDVTILPTPPSILLEWPPVSYEVVNLENIPVSDLEVVNPLLASDMSRFSWMLHADSLFGAPSSIGGASSSLIDETGVEEEEADLKVEGVEAAEVPKPSPIVTNGSVLRTESGTKKSPAKSTIERFPVRSASSAPRKNPPPSSTTTSKLTNTPAIQNNATAAKLQTPAKLRTPPKTTTQPIRPPPPAFPTKASIARQSVVSASRQPECRLPSKATKTTPKAVVSNSKSRSTLKSRSKSLPKAPSTTTVPAFSPVLDNTDAFMDADAEDEEEKHENGEKQSSVASRLEAVIQEKGGLTLERVNGCGDALMVKAKGDDAEREEREHEKEEVEEEEGDEDKARLENRMDKKRNVTTLFSRLGIRGTKQQKHQQRPVIVTPWRSEPSHDDTTPRSSIVAPVASSNLTASSPPRETTNPLQMWPSLASLHCIGWAKVTSNYAPQKSGELALLEGEIVSIFQKTTATWWMGEAGGKSGRFPVSHVEEF